MSRVKNTCVAVSFVLMVLTGSTAKTEASGIPVIDTANLVQSVLQALAWIQQFQQMHQQIVQADQQIHAIMGSRNMGSLLNPPMSTPYTTPFVPAEYRA
jgi:type IV secretion system protein VirB5